MGMPRLRNFQWSSVELWKMWSSGLPPHILIPGKQNLHELEIFWFPLLFFFGSSSTTAPLILLYSFNCHGIEKCLTVSNSLKWFAVLVQSTLSFYTISGNFEGWLNTCDQRAEAFIYISQFLVVLIGEKDYFSVTATVNLFETSVI